MATGSKAASWPAWFSGVDFVLAAFTVVFAFLVASFVARNSDVWLHLAAGKRLLAGEYIPGSDPFSYSGENRTWVNHSILFDLGTALLYSGNGSVLIFLKALAVAAAFGLLLGLRRPNFALWPWAVVAAIAVVAAAPYLHFRPFIGSMFFLAVTLLLLFRSPHRRNSWRFPVAIGVVFWLWANVDEWFFLGPLSLALLLIGELIQRSLRAPESTMPFGSTETTSPQPEEPLGNLPDVSTLAIALGIGLSACMLNPHHLLVWQLPFELVGNKDVIVDVRFKQLLLTPLDKFYTSESALGYNHNGLAYAILFVGGGLALGTARRVSIAYVALWIGFALMSIMSIYAIPFLAMVAVPVIASQLNDHSTRISLTSWGDPRTRFLLLGSAGGRVLTMFALLVGCVVAWPGWVHPPVGSSPFVRRVGWGIEPDPAMVRAAGQLQTWREAQQLSPDARGLIASTEFANYCAWFAPLEKVFVNGRYNHHRPEWSDYITVRVGLQLVKVDEQPSPNALSEVIRKNNVEYIAIHSGPGDSGPARVLQREATRNQWVDSLHWSPWYFDGRTTISGWRATPGSEKPSFTALRLDPVVQAFGPNVERIPTGNVQQIRPSGGWEDAFIRSPGITPPGFDEAFVWWMYRQLAEQTHVQQQQTLRFAAYLTDQVLGTAGLVFRIIPAPPPTDSQAAAAFLALWAARRAVAADPHHPDAYFALAQALESRELPIGEADRAVARITALRQCLERFPPPEDFQPGMYATSPTLVAASLANAYTGRRPEQYGNLLPGILVDAPVFGILSRIGATGFIVVDGNRPTRVSGLAVRPGQMQVLGGPYLLPLDIARETFQLAQRYADVEFARTEDHSKVQASLKEELKAVEGDLARFNNRFESRRATEKLAKQVELALENNLAGEALRLLTSKDIDPIRDFGQTALDFLLCRVSLELVLGRLEDASADLEILATDPGVQQRLSNPTVRAVFTGLQYQKALLEGNYPQAGKLMEELEGPRVREDPYRPLREQFDPRPFVESKQPLREWVRFAPLAAIGASSPFDFVGRTCTQVVSMTGFEYPRREGDTVLIPGFLTLQNELRGYREFQADFYYRRGVLFLLEGDIPSAEQRFRQTRLDAVKDWGLPEIRHPGAELYLRLIAEARKPAGVR
jgi:hypothetical protein